MHRLRKIATATSLCLTVGFAGTARAQQFNSDNYLSKPHGVGTIILTAGERSQMWMTTFSLFPRWEFTAAAYLLNTDSDISTDDGYSTSYYAKYMIHENQSKTGGAAVKFGTGLDPGYLIDNVGLEDAFQTYWMNTPVTFPFMNNRMSWDVMPGASVTRKYGVEDHTAWAFTYSTRLAYYPFDLVTSVVGEVFGATGEAENIPEYKVGVRFEPNQYVVLALSYGEEFDGPNGAGLEAGVMLFTPPFLKL